MAFRTSQVNNGTDHKGDPRTVSERETLGQQIAIPIKHINYLHLFRYATKKDACIVAVSLLCAVIAGAIITMPAVVTGLLVGSIQRSWTANSAQDSINRELTRYTIYFVYLFVAELITCYIATIGFIRTGIVLSSRIRERYLKALLSQNIAFFDNVGAGEIATHITADANLIRDGISEKVSVAVQCTSSVVTAFVIGFIKDWKLTLILSSGSIFVTIVFAAGGIIVTKYRQRWLAANAEAGTIAEEAFSSIRTLVGLNAQSQLAAQYDGYLAKAERWANKARLTSGLLLGAVYAGVYLTNGLGFWMGSRFLVAGTTSYVDILTIILAMVTGIASLGGIVFPLQVFAVATAAGSRLYSTIDRKPPGPSSDGSGETPTAVQGSIEFRNVRHIYPSRPEVTVLDQLNLVIEAGKTTAIVGPSGSGKSTVIELIERFYEPIGGEILLDGEKLSGLDVHWLRQHISLVQQSPTLFATTIFENIRYGLVGTPFENASEEEVRRLVYNAARTANAHNFVSKLPQGYDTLVGEAGVLLSGGQKQRIAIARALVRDPKILLLDEATSALDSTNEAIVQVAIDQASQGRTTITVAHRLSTVKSADNIVVLSGGRVVEQGTHNALMERKGTYSNLARVQAIDLGERKDPKDDPSVEMSEFPSDAALSEKQKLSSPSPKAGTRLSHTFHPDRLALQSLDRTHSDFSSRTLAKFMISFHKTLVSKTLQGFLWSVQAGAGAPIQAVFLAKCLVALAKPPTEYKELRSQTNIWAGMHVLLAFVQLVAYTAQGSTLGICTEKLIRNASDMTFRALLDKDMAFFDMEEHGVGALVSFLSTEPASMAGMGSYAAGTIIMALTTLIGAIAVSISVGWKLGLVCASTVPVLLVCGFLRFRVMAKLDAHLRKGYQETASFACEAIAAIRTVMSLNREPEVEAKV
jgi:ATP-binding cassette subfamily B (MDR/TAP) protein 1